MKCQKNVFIKSQVDVTAGDLTLCVNNNFFGVTSYNLILPRKINKSKTIHVDGNKMNNEAIRAIDKLQDGDIVIISDIKFWHKLGADFMFRTPSLIKVIVFDNN